MSTKTDLLAAMQADAKTLRSRIAELRDQRDALTGSIDHAEQRYHDACGDVGRPAPEADELHSRLSSLKQRLARGENERADAEQRLVDLDRVLGADDAAAAAERAVDVSRQVASKAESKLATLVQTSEKFKAQSAQELAAAASTRAAQVAFALHDLPADAKAALGMSSEAPLAPVGDPGAQEQRGVAFAEAAEKTDHQADAVRVEVEAARQAEESAVVELLRQRAYQAEFRHAKALAAYLPVLAEFRAAHDVAFGFAPELPAYKRHADESHGPAMVAAREAAQPQVEAGLLGRVKAAVRALA